MASSIGSKTKQESLYNRALLLKVPNRNSKEVRNLVILLIAHLSDAVSVISKAVTSQNMTQARKEINRIKASLSFYDMVPLKEKITELEMAIDKNMPLSELQNYLCDLIMLKVQTVERLKSDFNIK